MTQKHDPEQASPTNWNELMAHYGQAMLQVGKLEQEIALLKEIPVHSSPPVGVLEQINQYESEAARQKETVKALRLQIDDLQLQLAQSINRNQEESQTKTGNKRNPRNQHRKHHRRYWWQVWRPRRRARQTK